MKKIITLVALLYSGIAAAEIDSIEISGTFENENGCRAYNVHCVNFIGENDGKFNSCSLELYIDGEFKASLKKGGKITSASSEEVTAQDIGFRSSMVIIPSYKHVTAEFDIIKTTEDYSTYAETTVLSFDLRMKKSVLGIEVANCENMVLQQDEF